MSAYRGRNWSIVSYLENEDTILDIIRNCKNIRDYAFIYHNKDITTEGNIKPFHYHIALILRNARTREQVEKLFIGEDKDGRKINCLAEKTIDNKAIIQYFTHKNHPEKFQYDESLIISSDLKAFTERQTNEDNTFSIVEDMLSGLKLRELVARYGRDFLYHYTQIKTLVGDIVQEEKIYKRTFILSEVSDNFECQQLDFFNDEKKG